MYEFVDTTVESKNGNRLPAEALSINGDYIENLVVGYKTLYTAGREMLAPEVNTYDTGIRDGSVLKSKRYPARIITIGYQLIANDNIAFRKAYNLLNSILNVEEAKLIFADETDKFFMGTPSGVGEIPVGVNAVTGEFEILCVNPFKYSIEEYEVEPIDDGNTFIIDYSGTYKSFPKLEAEFYSENETGDNGETETALTGNGDCGYVAFFNENGNIIQLGDPDEEDTESYPKSQTLVNQDWKSVSAWTTALNAKWIKNNGRVSAGITSQTGTSGFSYSAPTDSNPAYYGYYLTAKNYGSDSKGFHGPTVSRILPEDASGELGATDWTFRWSMKVSIGDSSSSSAECGCVQILLCDDNDVIVAGVSIFKSGSGKTAIMRMYVRTQTIKDVTIDLSYRNVRFGTNKADGSFTSVKSCSITKSGSIVSFNLGGSKYSFTDNKIKNLVTTKFTMSFGQYKSKSPLSRNGIYSTKFVKNNCTTWRDIPNKFSTNDVVEADCECGEVLLNGASAPELGALGNDWEDFCLLPGINRIGVGYSDWVEKDYAPSFKIRYREVFI